MPQLLSNPFILHSVGKYLLLRGTGERMVSQAGMIPALGEFTSE